MLLAAAPSLEDIGAAAEDARLRDRGCGIEINAPRHRREGVVGNGILGDVEDGDRDAAAHIAPRGGGGGTGPRFVTRIAPDSFGQSGRCDSFERDGGHADPRIGKTSARDTPRQNRFVTARDARNEDLRLSSDLIVIVTRGGLARIGGLRRRRELDRDAHRLTSRRVGAAHPRCCTSARGVSRTPCNGPLRPGDSAMLLHSTRSASHRLRAIVAKHEFEVPVI